MLSFFRRGGTGSSPQPLHLVLCLSLLLNTLPKQQPHYQAAADWNFLPIYPIIDPNGLPGDSAGYAVANLNGVAIIGSPYATRQGQGNCGVAVAWHLDVQGAQWVRDSEIVLWNPASNDLFGASLDMFQPSGPSGPIQAAIGSYNHQQVFPGEGIVALFQQDASNSSRWDNITIITPSDAAAGNRFGGTVRVNGDTMLVTAPLAGPNGSFSGEAYLFGQNVGGPNNWGQKKALYASDGFTIVCFHCSSSLSLSSSKFMSELTQMHFPVYRISSGFPAPLMVITPLWAP